MGQVLAPTPRVDPPEEKGSCKSEKDVCPSIFLPLDRVWHELERSFPQQMSRFVLNIGAKDGVVADPLYVLFQAHPETEAVLVEPSKKSFSRLKSNYVGFQNAHLVNQGVDLRNFNQLLRKPGRVHDSSKPMDILKFDIDACECHMLELFLAVTDGYFRAKVIQIELNHVISPPLSYKDMCAENVVQRSSRSKDAWGCSMQAAYDVVKPYGYMLLQYDWPDAVFVHESYRDAFPCLLQGNPQEIFVRSFWLGHYWARQHYSRYRRFQDNKTWNNRIEHISLSSVLDPQGTLEGIINQFKPIWSVRPLWIELAVSGTGVRATVATTETGDYVVKWKTEENLAEHRSSPERPEL